MCEFARAGSHSRWSLRRIRRSVAYWRRSTSDQLIYSILPRWLANRKSSWQRGEERELFAGCIESALGWDKVKSKDIAGESVEARGSWKEGFLLVPLAVVDP